MNRKLGAIILAAGKGSRMKTKYVNKVAMTLFDKPMIAHTIELLEKLKVDRLVVVVGFAKSSVVNILGQKVIFAEQTKRLGTGHAVLCGLRKMPEGTENILVLNGDDSAFYVQDTIKKLIEKHLSTNAAFTFLTIEKNNPTGLGRVVRDRSGKVIAVAEEKDATASQRKINEINPGCYIFKFSFLQKYLPKIKKSPVTEEYYLTSLIDIGIKNNEIVETLPAGTISWRGVNTKEELEEAEKLLQKVK